MSTTNQVTQLLQAWGRGDAGALAQLVPLVEPELRRIARKCVAGERVGNSVEATALVNEAYIRLVDTQLSTTGAVLHVYERAGEPRYGEVEVGEEPVLFDTKPARR